jgi:site-specific recombinase XerD
VEHRTHGSERREGVLSTQTTSDGRHYVTWREDGKQCKKYFGRGDYARLQAERFDQEKKAEKGKIKVGGLLVSEVCQFYHDEHPVEESTRRDDHYKFSTAILPELGNIVAEYMTTKDLNRYIETRKRQGAKNTTIGNELRRLKAAFNWAARQDPPVIARNPIAAYRISLADDKSVPPPPSVAEIQRILNNSEPHLRRAIHLHWFTGIRPGGEMFRISWQEVDFGQNQIRITSARKGGAAYRYIPIEDQGFKEMLLAWFEEDRRWVEAERLKIEEGDAPKENSRKQVKEVWAMNVVHYHGAPVYSLKRSWKTAKTRAGVTRKLRLYDLRHAFASLALADGADLKSLSELLGHSRPDTTLRSYQHVTRKQHRDVVKRIPALGEHLGNVLPFPVSEGQENKASTDDQESSQV